MRSCRFRLLLVLCLGLVGTRAAGQSTAFTYQGALRQSGVAANGGFDMVFKLFDAVTNGTQSGATVTNANVTVSNGLFTTTLDFGASAFSATNRWLEISVRSNGTVAPFTVLNPRQPITPAPVALFALNGNIGATGSTGQNGTTVYGTAALSVTSATAFTLVPGLTQTFSVPSNSVVYVSTDGGVATTSAAATGFSVVDVSIFVDGVVLANAGSRRIFVTNNGGVVNVVANWSMSLSLPLTAGSHTILVACQGDGVGSNAVVSGDSSSLLQGQLTVLILRK